ncbi:NADH-quinone oxidoreductase subunit N [Bacteroidota bacterium]
MLSEIQLGSSLILISYFAISIVVVDALFQKNKNIGFVYALTGLIITAIASGLTLYDAPGIVLPTNTEDLLSKGMIIFGGYSAFFDILFCLGGILTILASKNYLVKEYKEYTEYYSLIIFAIAGMMLIGHANNLLVLFIGIELMSIPFYILAGFIRTNEKSVEASLKYFLLGAFSTGFLLYGIAMIYGATGSMDLTIISQQIINGIDSPVILAIGIGLIIIGLSFKVAAFPFHQWAPDVYHGSPTVVTAFMSTTGKAAALLAFIVIARALLPAALDSVEAGYDTATLQNIIAVISAATMLIGNITALVQKNVKRMLAYSSVAHAGYLLMGIVANSQLGWSGIAFYSTAYLFMQIGAFIIVGIIEKNNTNLNIEDYAGLSKTHPVMAALMALFMFSLAGIPPMAGFFGKYYLFAAAVKSGFTWLTIVAVIATIISMYYYISLVIQMYFKDQTEKVIETKTGLAAISLAVSGIAILLFGIFPSLLDNITNQCFKLFG